MGKGTVRLARIAGVLVGISLAALLLMGDRLPRKNGTLGADVTVLTGPIGGLEVPSGPFVRGTDLRPGGTAGGSVPVRNTTGRTLAVSIRVLPSIGDLDPLLLVQISTPGGIVYQGTLGGMRAWSHPFPIRSGQRKPVLVQIALPASATSGYQGRIDDVTLQFRGQAEGA